MVFIVTGAFLKIYLNITLFYLQAFKAVYEKFGRVWQNTLNNSDYPLLIGV